MTPACVSVAVVGAGAAGLAAVSVLRAANFRVTAFEGSSSVGGVWNYAEDPENGGPMYAGLSTNLPKEIMAFPDWPWPDRDGDSRSYVTHGRVLEYLRSYCYDRGLNQCIRLGHRVVSVRQRAADESGDSSSWTVETKESGPLTFDAVVLANGHFVKPMVPDLPGLSAFPADCTSHSCSYRRPEVFRDKTVALLGAAASGQDIALELSTAARRVLLCHRGPPLKSRLPDNVAQLGPIVELTSAGRIVCRRLPGDEDSGDQGTLELPVDHVMFCTGYDYHYPFLDPDCAVTKATHVPGLYMHVAHCTRPGLYFLGLCTHIVPFPQFHLQAKLIQALLEGRAALPRDARAASDLETAAKLASGVAPRHLHLLSDAQWEYNDQLADLAGCPRLPGALRRIYEHVKVERSLRLGEYKRLAYRITGPDTFETARIV